MSQKDRLATGGRINRAIAADLHVQRPHVSGPSGRHARLRAARERRALRRAQLEVSPAARHRDGGCRRAECGRAARNRRVHGAECARDRSRAVSGTRRDEREREAEHRERSHGDQPEVRALHSGGLLLQDVHVAAQVLAEVRGSDPRCSGSRQGARACSTPIATTSASRIATCWWSAAGPSGLAAAHAAGLSGARVILVDDQPELGGSLLSCRAEIDGKPALQWVQKIEAELRKMPDVKILSRSTAFGYQDHNLVTITQRLTDHLPVSMRKGTRELLWKVRAKRVILATGAHERPHRVRQQRSAGRDAGVGGVDVSASLCGAAGAQCRRVHEQRRRLSVRARPQGGGRRR